MKCITLLYFLLPILAAQEDLPTLYEYYTEGGIESGLDATAEGFKLNGKDINIYSGAIHYFRVHPDYWRSSLRKARAAGLVAVETYVPWNLHEPQMDVLDFGDGDNDMSMFLNITKFIRMAQEEDLLVILRPGPYICAEWEFGGFPSWLLRSKGIVTRTSDSFFVERVKKYFDKLLPKVAELQFINGGPIIMVQIENEYGNFDPSDKDYLQFLKQTFEDNGLKGLFVTSDGAKRGTKGAIPGVLQTLNFNADPDVMLPQLEAMQPDKPLMVMEFWSGWFTHWMDEKPSHGIRPSLFREYLEKICKYNASANIYMFHGGTDFGFLNGASKTNAYPEYASDITSYDYNAVLTEAGDYSSKYEMVKSIIGNYTKIRTKLPELPEQTIKAAYPAASIQEYLSIDDVIDRVPEEDKTQIESVVSMELLDVNGGSGQSYGYVVYRKTLELKENSVLRISGHVRDVAILLVDGVRKTKQPTSLDDISGFGYWLNSDMEFSFAPEDAGKRTVDILVENWGRDNSGNTGWFNPSKGLSEGPVLLDGEELSGFQTISLQFKSQWIKGLSGWRSIEADVVGPALLRTSFNIEGTPADTFLDMSNWGKGIVFINGFNLGRYLNLGPPKTLYVPAPLLKQGANEVIIFEHYSPASEIIFSDTPNLG